MFHFQMIQSVFINVFIDEYMTYMKWTGVEYKLYAVNNSDAMLIYY